MSGVVIVTGSRDWTDGAVLGRALQATAPTLVVHGAARGADALADAWAKANGVPVKPFEAPWTERGHAAGMIRNVAMLEAYPEALVLAFPLPQSRGTRGCMWEAARRGHRVMVVEPSGMWSLSTPVGRPSRTADRRRVRSPSGHE